MTLLLFSTAGYRGSHYDPGNSGTKILKKLKVFSLPLFNRCNFTLPQTGKEHLNKNLISCDVRVHSDDITIECIFVSAILNLSHRGQQSLPIPQASKMASSVKIHVLWKH